MADTTRYAACLDIGGTKALMGLVDEAGQIMAQERYLLGSQRQPEKIIMDLTARCRALAIRAGLNWDKRIGVGCSIAGMLDARSGTVFSAPNLFGSWRDVPFQHLLQRAFDRPALIEMDAHAAALGEGWRGTGVGVDHFIYVVVGTGIGTGILIHGQLLRGWRGTAGELGHTTIEPGGPLCNCGNFGCLEALAAGPAMAQRASEAIEQDRPTLLSALAAAQPLDAVVVMQAARQGDAVAREIIRQSADYLGIGLANLLNLLNPEVIALGGGVIQGGIDLLLEPIRQATAHRCGNWIDWNRTRIIPAALGEDASLLGMARLVWDAVG